jgi:hypothetical protein
VICKTTLILNYFFSDNPVNHFPVYEPSAERVAEIARTHAESNNPLNVHYDASHEVRAKGAAFYQLSGDEETRRRQMEELKSTRLETEKTRQEMGAVDIKPGEVEGMRDEGAPAGVKSRAAEKRKRDIEERRRIVDAKRKKQKGGEGGPSTSGKIRNPEPIDSGAPVASDPFAALEKSNNKIRGDVSKKTSAARDADMFLAQLEQEILGGKRT